MLREGSTEQAEGKGDAFTEATPPAAPPGRQRRDWRTFASRYGTLLFLGAVMVFFTLRSSNQTFIQPDNLLNILKGVAFLAIVAGGLTVCLVNTDFDLSIAANATLSGIIAAVVARDSGSTARGMLVGLVAGVLAGLANGLVVTRLRVPPFIATLALGLFVLKGIQYLVSGGLTITGGLPVKFTTLGRGELLGVRYTILIAVAVLVALWLLLQHTEVGRYMYAVGGNPVAARLSGVDIERVRLVAFVISGACAGLAGVLLASNFNSGNPAVEGSLLLDAFTACFIGAATLRVGEFHIPGTAIGVVTLGILTNGMTLSDIEFEYQSMAKGVILILAVAVSGLLRRR